MTAVVQRGGARPSPFLDMQEGRIPYPPVAVLLGWQTLEFDDDIGYMRGAMTAGDEFLNPHGTLQGGILCTMLDNAAGLAVMCTLSRGQTAPTLEIKTSFMRPGRPGAYIAEGKIASQAAGICFVEGKLMGSSGQLVATATATVRILTAR